jgi:hypothetical protein
VPVNAGLMAAPTPCISITTLCPAPLMMIPVQILDGLAAGILGVVVPSFIVVLLRGSNQAPVAVAFYSACNPDGNGDHHRLRDDDGACRVQAMPVRAALAASTDAPLMMIPVQILDGLAAGILGVVAG